MFRFEYNRAVSVYILVFPASPQDERYEEACSKFTHAQQVVGYMPHLSYNIALCHYKLKHYAPALKAIGKAQVAARRRYGCMLHVT